MSPFEGDTNRRVLIVDDNPAIHEDFLKVLRPPESHAPMEAMEASLFGEAEVAANAGFELGFAHQGNVALEKVREGLSTNKPYALAFVDIRMPPGWDGVETALRLWEADPRLQIVICSAYSDYSWEQMNQKLGARQQLLILKKPFDAIEVLQLAHALTEKWQLLIASKRTLSELESAVASRTEALETTNQKLIAEMRLREEVEARLSAAKRLEALGRLAGGIAHEINNPLSFIVSNLEFIDKVTHELEVPIAASEDLGQATSEALKGADRIRRIIRDVKVFAHSESAPVADVDLKTVVDRAVAMARAEIDRSGSLTVDIGEGSIVRASEEGLTRVLYNLLANATQALAADRVADNRISIVTSRAADGRVQILVRDNGCGIQPEHVSKIFEPFFTTKDIGKGTGLGLSICHGIVTRLSGEITVHSEPGVGTCFQVTLPTPCTARAAA